MLLRFGRFLCALQHLLRPQLKEEAGIGVKLETFLPIVTQWVQVIEWGRWSALVVEVENRGRKIALTDDLWMRERERQVRGVRVKGG